MIVSVPQTVKGDFLRTVYYVGYYDAAENAEENRNYVLSASNKMTYICRALNNIGCQVQLLSASATKNTSAYPAKDIAISDMTTLHLFKTAPWGNKLRRIYSTLSLRARLLFALMRVKKNTPVMVYHSLALMHTVRLAKRLRRFPLVLEVEEIYADVLQNAAKRRQELRFFKCADAFVFPTALLDEPCNPKEKPFAVIHGTYQCEPPIGTRFDDGKIHCVYAGTLDPRKGGATAAVAAGEFLDARYHIHILGFGSDADKAALLDQIERVNAQAGCSVTYDGVKSGEDYVRFLQSCDLGLSTQTPDAAFNATSFPSKILSYMANGLRVVSIRIPAIEGSAVGKYMYYYDEQTPQKIAAAIMAAGSDDGYDGRAVLKTLDAAFQEDMKKVLGDIL